MLKFALIAFVLVLVFLGYAATRPDTFHVERSIRIQAPAAQIFPLINDFRRWDAWTPFNKDPAMKKTYSGSAQGEGAMYAWAGNKDVGTGDITIRQSEAPHKIVFDLHMVAPFEGRNVATIRLDESAGGTTVTWSLDDRHNLMLKVMRLLIDLDKKIGGEFETGLARLQTAVRS
jgi:hypothetical protein